MTLQPQAIPRLFQNFICGGDGAPSPSHASLLSVLPPPLGAELLFLWLARASDLARIECALRLLRPNEAVGAEPPPPPQSLHQLLYARLFYASAQTVPTNAEIAWAESRGLGFRCETLGDSDPSALNPAYSRVICASTVLHSDAARGDRPASLVRFRDVYSEDLDCDVVEMEWYRYMLKHREGDRPAVIRCVQRGSVGIHGGLEWRQADQLHRTGGAPALVSVAPPNNGFVEESRFVWTVNGRPSRPGGRPTAVIAPGTLEWHDEDGLLHRDDRDRPAAIDVQRGVRKWAHLGRLHREGGRPAVREQHPTFRRSEWWINGTPVRRRCWWQHLGEWSSTVWMDAQGHAHRALPWPAFVATGGLGRRWRYFWHGREINDQVIVFAVAGCAYLLLLPHMRPAHASGAFDGLRQFHGVFNLYYAWRLFWRQPQCLPIVDVDNQCTEHELNDL